MPYKDNSVKIVVWCMYTMQVSKLARLTTDMALQHGFQAWRGK